MQYEPSHALHASRPGGWRDAMLAVGLAVLLSACWAFNDWPQLRRLILPDTDDMMRLAQVRDWIAGQSFADWTQYRLGPVGGAPMHWSRIADLGPAALIVALTPMLGAPRAELAAIILYPACLFAIYLFASARIARAMGARDTAAIALLLAALAYPANALFLPGRIDHHGLQILLIQVMILAFTRRPNPRGGAMAGAALGISFGIGLEAALQAAVLMALLLGRWIVDGERERPRVLGFGIALVATTLMLVLFARPAYWTRAWCDGFTPASVAAAIGGGVFWIALALATPRLGSARSRLLAGGALAAAIACALYIRYPGCVTGPYGPMPDMLRAAMIGNITEARGAFDQQTIASGLRAVGLLFFATGVAAWLLLRQPLRRDVILPSAAVLAISTLVAVAQVRAAYIGAAVAAPVLAQLVLAARNAPRLRGLALIGAWTASAGIVWMALPLQIERLTAPQVARAGAARQSCREGDLWAQIDRLPRGTIVSGIDHGARIIGATRHRALGAGYHRNIRGNLGAYGFFLAEPEAARTIARYMRIDYIAFCPGDFGELGVATRRPASMAARLDRGEPPSWATVIPLRDTAMRFYRIR